MSFGDILKQARTEHGDTFQKLGKKVGLSYVFILRVEKGEKQPSKKLLTEIIKIYPSYKQAFITEYCKEKLPSVVIENLNDTKNLISIIFNILSEFKTENKQNILHLLVDQMELLLYKENKKRENTLELIEQARDKIKDI